MKSTVILAILTVCASAQGPLTPLGPPGLEMKSLQEIWDKAGGLETRIVQTRARISSAAAENRLLAGLVSLPAVNRPWLITTVDTIGDVGESSSVAIGPDGYPAISCVSQNPFTLKFARFNGSNWLTETLDTAPNNGIYYTSLAFGPDGHPAISYYHPELQQLRFTRFDGTSWNITVVDSNGGNGFGSSLVFGPDGQPAISYGYYGSHPSGGLRFARFDGAAWNITDVDSSAGFVKATSLAIGPDGNPAVAYRDELTKDLKFVRHNGSAWQPPTIVDTVVDAGYSISLAFGPTGHPAIAYDSSSHARLSFAAFDGANWNVQSLEFAKIDGVSLAYGPDGQAAIAYGAGPISFSNDLKYARFNGSTWIYENIQVGGFSGSISLVFGADGQPMISYYDDTNGDLKFARRGIFKPKP
jgi:hypothetical protein